MHIRTHTGERPYQWPHCWEIFYMAIKTVYRNVFVRAVSFSPTPPTPIGLALLCVYISVIPRLSPEDEPGNKAVYIIELFVYTVMHIALFKVAKVKVKQVQC